MSAISAQSHSRSTDDPSTGAPVARHLSQAAGTLPRKKIASLHARERQGATRRVSRSRTSTAADALEEQGSHKKPRAGATPTPAVGGHCLTKTRSVRTERE